MVNESTVVIAPELQESPARRPEESYAPMQDQRSDDYDDDDDNDDDIADDLEETAADGGIDETVIEETEVETAAAESSTKNGTNKKPIKLSRHGIEYPSLPPAVVKRLAQTFAKTSGAKGNITPETLKAIMQASDWFFEQIGEDLEAYAKHAHRKTIDESDMLTLMKRYVSFLKTGISNLQFSPPSTILHG